MRQLPRHLDLELILVFAYMCKLVDSVNVKTIQNKCISFAGRLSERDIIDDSAELIVLMVCVRS